MLVGRWLEGIGLDYAVGSFQAAGITTPAALAELEVEFFSALGVESAEDRRKLFFLVQRIKMEVENNNDATTTPTNRRSTSVVVEVDNVLAKTGHGIGGSGHGESISQTSSVTNDCSYYSGGEGGGEATTTTATLNTMDSNEMAPDNEKQKNDPEAARNEKARSTKTATTATTARQSRRLQQERDGVLAGRQEQRGENAITSAAMAPRTTAGRDDRTSIGSAASQSTTTDCNNNSNNPKNNKKRFSGVPQPKPRGAPRRTSTGSVSSATSAQSCGASSAGGNNSGHRGRKSAGGSIGTSGATNAPAGGAVVGTGHRHHHQPRSMRTGKQLSAIPSNSIAPMSPLVDLSSNSKLVPATSEGEAAAADSGSDPASGQQQMSRVSTGGSSISSHLASTRTRLHLTGSFDDEGDDDDDGNRSYTSIGSKNKHRRSRLSSSGASSGNRRRVSGLHSAASTRQSQGGASGNRRTTIQGVHSRSETPSTSPSRSSSNASQQKRPPPQEDSFKAQIAVLREDNEEEFRLFSGGSGTATTSAADEVEPEDMRIRVVVRKRPLSKNERAAAGDVDVIHPLDYGAYGRILVYQPKTRVDLTKQIETIPFSFDNVFDEAATNRVVYERSVRSLIPSFLEGRWVSIFCYGQTGAGKTFTMMGPNNNSTASAADPNVAGGNDNLGLYYMAALDIFHQLRSMPEYSVKVSFFEIYGGKLFDLLNDRAAVKCLENHHGRVCFPGLSQHTVESASSLLEHMETGLLQRSTGTTSRNADSSRSHAVMQLHLCRNQREFSQLTFIDLAGSERGADTSSSSRATRMEGAEINTSLLALKEVIRAMATGEDSTHVPFRGSKLTQVLKQSFVGSNCQSVMIACISPNIGNCEQTLNTLRYADRVKERNAETGQLSNPPAPVASTRRPAALDKQMSQSSQWPSTAESEGSGDFDATTEVDVSAVSDASALLDDILATPRAAASRPQSPARTGGGAASTTVSSRDNDASMQAAARLVASHREAMASMLDMVRDEMELVNGAEQDREQLDEYISAVKEIQEQQLSYIVTLRQQLLDYHEAAAAENSAADQQADVSLGDSDDSFEDLRD